MGKGTGKWRALWIVGASRVAPRGRFAYSGPATGLTIGTTSAPFTPRRSAGRRARTLRVDAGGRFEGRRKRASRHDRPTAESALVALGTDARLELRLDIEVDNDIVELGTELEI